MCVCLYESVQPINSNECVSGKSSFSNLQFVKQKILLQLFLQLVVLRDGGLALWTLGRVCQEKH